MNSMVTLLFHDVFARDPAESGFRGPQADRYKLSAAEFGRVLAVLRALATGPPALVGRDDGGQFALTVDDGGVSYYTAFADAIERLGWRGHCFVTTNFIGRSGFLDVRQIRELDRRGHVVGCHSATHPPRFSACSRSQMLDEWRSSRQALEDILGHQVRIGSLPGGYFSPAVAASAAEAGLRHLFTSEPVMASRVESGCACLGRFTVRPGRAARVAPILTRRPLALWRERAVWTAKKTVKPALGAAYPWLSAHLSVRPWRRLSERGVKP